MSSIYQKTGSDKTCILAPREYFQRPFDFGDWTEMRIGMYVSGVAASGDDTASASELVTTVSAADRFTVGIKDSATTALPGEVGSLFVGIGSFGGKSNSGANDFYSNIGANNASSQTFVGTSQQGGSAGGMSTLTFPTAGPSTGYCGWFGIKFTIANRGLSTQTISVVSGSYQPISGTDYSASALRTDINNYPFPSADTFAWNDGVAAREIPDSIWVRMPFYSNRLRLSCIMGVRYAP